MKEYLYTKERRRQVACSDTKKHGPRPAPSSPSRNILQLHFVLKRRQEHVGNNVGAGPGRRFFFSAHTTCVLLHLAECSQLCVCFLHRPWGEHSGSSVGADPAALFFCLVHHSLLSFSSFFLLHVQTRFVCLTTQAMGKNMMAAVFAPSQQLYPSAWCTTTCFPLLLLLFAACTTICLPYCTGHGREHTGSDAGAESAPGFRSSTQLHAF